jgi:hypothetical protein
MKLIMPRVAAQHFSNRTLQTIACSPHSAVLAALGDSVRAIGCRS